MVWLGIMAQRYYRAIMGDIVLATFSLPAAITFYVSDRLANLRHLSGLEERLADDRAESTAWRP
ncbi:MAG: hypothetical protein AB7S93_26540 [Xanthobacteraceae bacterium]